MNPVELFRRWFPGWAAALAAIGQIALGVYQVTEGNVELGLTLIAVNLGVLFESMRK